MVQIEILSPSQKLIRCNRDIALFAGHLSILVNLSRSNNSRYDLCRGISPSGGFYSDRISEAMHLLQVRRVCKLSVPIYMIMIFEILYVATWIVSGKDLFLFLANIQVITWKHLFVHLICRPIHNNLFVCSRFLARISSVIIHLHWNKSHIHRQAHTHTIAWGIPDSIVARISQTSF